MALTLTFWPRNLISTYMNQNTSVTKIWWNSLHWFLGYDVHKVFATHRLTGTHILSWTGTPKNRLFLAPKVFFGGGSIETNLHSAIKSEVTEASNRGSRQLMRRRETLRLNRKLPVLLINRDLLSEQVQCYPIYLLHRKLMHRLLTVFNSCIRNYFAYELCMI